MKSATKGGVKSGLTFAPFLSLQLGAWVVAAHFICGDGQQRIATKLPCFTLAPASLAALLAERFARNTRLGGLL